MVASVVCMASLDHIRCCISSLVPESVHSDKAVFRTHLKRTLTYILEEVQNYLRCCQIADGMYQQDKFTFKLG